MLGIDATAVTRLLYPPKRASNFGTGGKQINPACLASQRPGTRPPSTFEVPDVAMEPRSAVTTVPSVKLLCPHAFVIYNPWVIQKNRIVADACKARFFSSAWFIILERTDGRAVFKRLSLTVKAELTAHSVNVCSVHMFPAKHMVRNNTAYWQRNICVTDTRNST